MRIQEKSCNSWICLKCITHSSFTTKHYWGGDISFYWMDREQQEIPCSFWISTFFTRWGMETSVLLLLREIKSSFSSSAGDIADPALINYWGNTCSNPIGQICNLKPGSKSSWSINRGVFMPQVKGINFLKYFLHDLLRKTRKHSWGYPESQPLLEKYYCQDTCGDFFIIYI